MSGKIAVIIPAFNAAKTIAALIEKIQKEFPELDVVVIDDGSTDQTFSLAKKAQAIVLQHPVNLGKGEALRTGFKYATEKKYSYVITLDADLQHDPRHIKDFLRIAKNDKPDFILGTRHFSFQNMPWDRVLTNSITSVMLTILSGQKIKDSQSGYRMISEKVLKDIRLKGKKYDLESEILIKAGRKGFKIQSLEISTIYAGSQSFINPFSDTGRFLRICWKSLFW
jgi:glycosyltransferase involved in cell wall biosynthesis